MEELLAVLPLPVRENKPCLRLPVLQQAWEPCAAKDFGDAVMRDELRPMRFVPEHEFSQALAARFRVTKGQLSNHLQHYGPTARGVASRTMLAKMKRSKLRAANQHKATLVSLPAAASAAEHLARDPVLADALQRAGLQLNRAAKHRYGSRSSCSGGWKRRSRGTSSDSGSSGLSAGTRLQRCPVPSAASPHMPRQTLLLAVASARGVWAGAWHHAMGRALPHVRWPRTETEHPCMLPACRSCPPPQAAHAHRHRLDAAVQPA